MLLHHCRICDQEYLVGTRSIASLHNTSEGPIGYVRCPAGHLTVRRFRHDRQELAAGRSPQRRSA